MDQKDIIKYGLLALGAYLIWKYIEDNGGLSSVLGTATGTGTGAGTTAVTGACNDNGRLAVLAAAGVSVTAAQQTAMCAGQNVPLTDAQSTQLTVYNAQQASMHLPPPTTTPVSSPAPTPPAGGPYVPTDYNPCVGGVAVWNASAGAALNGGAQPSTVPQSAAAVTCVTTAGCPIGQTNVNGVCTVEPAGATLISQQMLAAATTATGAGTALNMDQWDYYYQMVTGSAFPIDPGSIPPGVYAGAGIVDRTTPTDIGTWLAIMQNQDPSLGLSGLGMFSYRYTPAWLM